MELIKEKKMFKMKDSSEVVMSSHASIINRLANKSKKVGETPSKVEDVNNKKDD